jgi:hypothetical protein
VACPWKDVLSTPGPETDAARAEVFFRLRSPDPDVAIGQVQFLKFKSEFISGPGSPFNSVTCFESFYCFCCHGSTALLDLKGAGHFPVEGSKERTTSWARRGGERDPRLREGALF